MKKKHNVIINQFGLSDFESESAIYYKNTQSFVKHWQGLSIDSGDKYTLKKLDNYVKEKNIKNLDFNNIIKNVNDIKLNYLS